MAGRPKVSVLILNWNGRQHLPECLGSLAAQSFRAFEVILVDNGSIDGSAELVRHDFPWVKLVESPDNRGFAGGNNLALAHAAGDYIVTLNNDTRAEPGWLAALVRTADAHPEAGMVGSRICVYDRPGEIDSLGVRITRDGMSRGGFRGRAVSEFSLDAEMEILFPSACAALYRRSMLDETGFFDEDFFAYCEDTDLGLRGRLAGWQALLAPAAVVRHKYSGTSGAFSPFKLFLVERNHYWVALKCFPMRELLPVPLFTVGRYLVQAWAVLAKRGAGEQLLAAGARSRFIKALLKGTWEAFRGVPAMLERRREIMRSARLSGRQMAALLKKHRMGFRELLGIDA